jgi:bleomycin hydrolase
MGAQTSRPMVVEKPNDPATPSTNEKADNDAYVHVSKRGDFGEQLAPSHLAQWGKDFDEVRMVPHDPAAAADSQSPSLPLARLVLSKADPLQSLSVRNAIVHDAKIFNLQLKGLGPKGEYPGPRVNQAQSGRCWLFATSESA